MKTNIIFLGGIFLPEQIKLIQANSIGPIQNAADSLQKNIIRGIKDLENVKEINLTVINLPFIGSYPKRFKSQNFPGNFSSQIEGATVKAISFKNIIFIKHISRTMAAFFAIRKLTKHNEKNIILIYSMHLPFLLASSLIKLKFPKTKVCLVIPDLPEFMGGTGILQKISQEFNAKICRYLLRKYDYFVTLTKAMIDYLGLPSNSSIVMEGIATEISFTDSKASNYNLPKNKAILYTGTLAKRYGILELIKAFQKIPDENISLWICGDGDGKDFVTASSAADKRIIYFGQISREEIYSLQKTATILVNPRQPNNEFTKYSFPSKILEYMSSGRPVIMHRLEGIPEEYYSYCITPKDFDIESLSECISEYLKLSDEELSQIGIIAKNFALTQKNSKSQATRILDLILKR